MEDDIKKNVFPGEFHPSLEKNKVAGTGNRKEFCKALDKAEDGDTKAVASFLPILRSIIWVPPAKPGHTARGSTCTTLQGFPDNIDIVSRMC